ncbi:MAG: uracil-DNA glycosylase, partial [Pseudomonadota bacterium]
MFDISGLGGWANLEFFANDLRGISQQIEGLPFLPPPDLTFAALARTQPTDTTVVILGQDPYHTPGKADGLAFSIPEDFGGRLDSLGNIFKEIESDLGVIRTKTSLHDWADQGVLLLNTALTVPPGKPKAHAKLGWTMLVQQALDRLNDRPRAYLLWGGPAQSYAKFIRPDALIHTSAHPSPLSVHRGFFNSRP